jgi:hypothetical protein
MLALSYTLREEDVDQEIRHRLGMPTHRLDLLIAEIVWLASRPFLIASARGRRQSHVGHVGARPSCEASAVLLG